MPSWPGSLPLPPLSADIAEADGLVVTEMEQPGATKRRARFSTASRRIECELILTGTQRSALDTFFASDCSRGVTAFTLTDPVSASSADYYFLERPQPRRALAGASAAADRKWVVRLRLERAL